MANSLNIGGGDDEFFRYKMPPLQAKVEGRGNGIKTRVVNCADVAKALKRPAGYVCKFFGCELGALTKINDNENEYIVNGSHTVQALTQVLQKFIQMFVLCRKCSLPETDLKVNEKNHTIKAKCSACGHTEMVDLTHKLCNYIYNNPPPKRKAARPAANVVNHGFDMKGDTTKSKKKSKSKGADDADDGKVDKKSKKKSKSEDKTEKKSENKVEKQEDEVNGSVASTMEKQLAIEPQPVPAKAEPIKENDEEDEDEEEEDGEDEHPVTQMIMEGMGPKKITTRVKAMTPKPEEQVKLLMLGFLRDSFMESIQGVIESLVKAVKLIEITPATGPAICFTLDEIAENEPEIVSKLVVLIKMLYDIDIVEEDHITGWYKKASSESAKAALKPLVEWLENAEEESDEE